MFSLLKYKTKDITDPKGKELIRAARWKKNNNPLETIKNLLESKADVNHTDQQGRTALFWLDNDADIPSIKYLLEHHADVNHRDDFGNTALHRAVVVNSFEVVKVLLENKADPNLENKNQETPLHKAAEYGNEKIVNLLIEYKASSEKGWSTPYEIAQWRLEHSDNESEEVIRVRQGTFFALSPEGISYSKARTKYKEDLQDYEKAAQITMHSFDMLTNIPTVLPPIILSYLKPVEPQDPRTCTASPSM